MRDRIESGAQGIGRIIAIALVLMCFAATARAEMREAEVVAAYLYNFSKFVTWPAESLPSTETPLTLCVYGRPSSADTLDALNGKPARGHPVQVEHRARGDALRGCHIIYVSTSEQPYLTPLLGALGGRPVLTVSELPGFASAGGTIGFVRTNDRLRFEINTASAEAAGLTISSQLLKLATRVLRD